MALFLHMVFYLRDLALHHTAADRNRLLLEKIKDPKSGPIVVGLGWYYQSCLINAHPPLIG